jgi:organic hydroperoxide reductase OsmC/OhrA
MIEVATGKQAFRVGKPSPIMMRMARKVLGLATAETIMIGDTMRTDILGAGSMGFTTVLTLSRRNTSPRVAYLYHMGKAHHYALRLVWTGNKGEGTSTYRSYDRSYTISVKNKPDFSGSSDAMFRGDATKYNPEDLLVMALSSCHLLSYLHLCADNGIVVTSYEDDAVGVMTEDAARGGFFSEVTLNIAVKITDDTKKELAAKLHHDANRLCFIANSVNFPVRHMITFT